jgi:hypothetical protein
MRKLGEFNIILEVIHYIKLNALGGSIKLVNFFLGPI